MWSNYRQNMCCVGLFYHFTQIPWRAQNASKIYSHLRATTGILACSSAAEGNSLCQGWCDFWTAESIQWVTECWWKTKERRKMYKHVFIWKDSEKKRQRNTHGWVPKPPPVWSRGSRGLDLGISRVSHLHLHWGQLHSAGKTMRGGEGWLSELKDGAQVSAPSFKLGDAWPCTRGSTMESAALQREVFT